MGSVVTDGVTDGVCTRRPPYRHPMWVVLGGMTSFLTDSNR